MQQNGSIALFDYWNRLRDGRTAPRRTEIEPSDIKTLLADTFILERDTRGQAVFRLAGTRLCATYGRELKGFSFPSLWREKDRNLVARLVESAFGTHTLVVLTYQGKTGTGRSTPFEMLILPLDGGVESPRCVGLVSSADRPFWLGADAVVDGVIESVRVVDPDREPMFLKNRPAIGVPALEPEDIGHLPRPLPPGGGMRRIRHLLVLDGGRA